MEACLVAKLSCLPEGVARSLKENATFVEEEGPMRQAVLAVCPPTKAELIKSNQGALDAAMKVRRESLFFVFFSWKNLGCRAILNSSKVETVSSPGA